MSIGAIQLAEIAKQQVGGLTTIQAISIAEAQLKIIKKQESHDLRFARYMRKQLGQQLGKASSTIHALRGELALVRQQKQQMLNQGISELIKDAVLTAVPIEFVDGELAPAEKPADLSAAGRVTGLGHAQAVGAAD